jgi:hypothetical protein
MLGPHHAAGSAGWTAVGVTVGPKVKVTFLGPYSRHCDDILTFHVTTLLIMTLITLNTGDITYNDITYNINKCSITYMFLSTVIRKVIISKISYRQSCY